MKPVTSESGGFILLGKFRNDRSTLSGTGGGKLIAIAAILVLISGFLHALWNLFAKKSMDKNVFLWFCQWLAILAFLPWAMSDIDHFRSQPVTYLLLLVSMFLHGLYVLLLANAYSVGDLSQVYPIMRGTSPLAVPLAGVMFLNESLSVWGWAGVLLIVYGIGWLGSPSTARLGNTDSKAVFLALSVGLCVAAYITVDKLTLNYMSPVILNLATNIGNLLALSWAALKPEAIKKEWNANWKTIILCGLIAPGGYLLFLFALKLAQVAQLAPMREIGTVFGTLLGILILRERQGTRRITASILITLGVILLGVWG